MFHVKLILMLGLSICSGAIFAASNDFSPMILSEETTQRNGEFRGIFTTFADITNDGKPDLITFRADEWRGPVSMNWSINDGTKLPFVERTGFAPNTYRLRDLETVGVVDVAPQSDFIVKDVNADGLIDIVFTDSSFIFSERRFYTLLNTGITPRFKAPTLVATFPRGDQIGLDALVDLDGDLDLDIIGTQRVDNGGGKTRISLNQGQPGTFGPFSAPIDVGTLASREQLYDVVVGDIDADGDQDIVESRELGIMTFLNNGTAAPFSPQSQRQRLTDSSLYSGVALADINQDSLLDLIVAGSLQQSLYYLNQGNGALFENAPANKIGPADRHYNSVSVQDISGDGVNDLLLANTFSKAEWFINSGQATPFAPSDDGISVTERRGPYRFSLFDTILDMADIDGDGDIDVLTRGSGYTTNIYLNNGFTGDRLPALTVSNQTVSETVGSLQLNFELSEPASNPVTLEFGTQRQVSNGNDGIAESGTDYYGLFQKVRFAPGETSLIVPITVLADDVVESDETINGIVSLLNGATIENDIIEITIEDAPSDVTPTLSITAPSTAFEWDDAIEFELRLSNRTTRTVEATLETVSVPGGATPDVDFVSKREVVRFAPGELTQTFSVEPVFDAELERTEAFTVRIINLENALTSQSEIPGTITDDLPAKFSLPELIQAVEGDLVQIPVSLNRPFNEPMSVYVATSARLSAKPGAGNDFYGFFNQVTFSPGETQVTVPLRVLKDTESESTESMVVRAFFLPNGVSIDETVVEIRD